MAVDFKASQSQSLRIPYVPSFASARFSLSAWVTPRTVTGTRRIVGRASSASPANEVYALEISAGQARFLIGQATTVWVIIFPMTTYGVDVVAGGTIPVGKTSYIAGTYDGTTARLYVNGYEVAKAAHTNALLTGTAPISIGGDYDGNSTTNYFDGAIEAVKLYNRALSANEVLTHYTTRSACASSYGLVLNLSMNEGSRTDSLPAQGAVPDMGPMGNTAFNASMSSMMFADAFIRSRKNV